MYKNFFIGLPCFKRDEITQKTRYSVMNIVPANMLFVNIEGHTYIEKNSQIFICHIFEINITNMNNIAYYNINTTKINVSILLQKLKLKNF